MNPQNKRIESFRVSSNQTQLAVFVIKAVFEDAPSVNIHGVNVTLGMSPFGPDETLVGRWYVVVLPPSVAKDAAIQNAWIANLNTTALANVQLKNTEYVWGAGSFVAGEQSTVAIQFSPKTSRNMKKDSALYVIVVADAISGVSDDWDAAATVSLFETS